MAAPFVLIRLQSVVQAEVVEALAVAEVVEGEDMEVVVAAEVAMVRFLCLFN